MFLPNHIKLADGRDIFSKFQYIEGKPFAVTVYCLVGDHPCYQVVQNVIESLLTVASSDETHIDAAVDCCRALSTRHLGKQRTTRHCDVWDEIANAPRPS